jgi:hypothetical protein
MVLLSQLLIRARQHRPKASVRALMGEVIQLNGLLRQNVIDAG